MKENIKFIIFDNIYRSLGLKDIESKIEKNNIKPKNIENPTNISLVSKYFFLLNDIYLENFKEEELGYLNQCYLDYKKGNHSKLYEFLNENMQELLFVKNEKKSIKYGNFIQSVPSDAIAIAFHYNNLECTEEQENFICDMLNYVQYNLAKKINMKVAILKYGMYVNNQNFAI